MANCIHFCILLFIFLNSIVLQECKKSKEPVTILKSSASTTTKPAKVHTYTVVKVADGDTITVKNNSNSNLLRIRFLCIDAPEKSQGKWGEMSLKKLGELLPQKSEVTLKGSQIDPYKRIVAEIINAKGLNVNRKMLDLGLVVHYPFQKGCDEYKEAEKVAKKAKAGVWNDAKFELPWNYRKRMGIGLRGANNTIYNSNKQVNNRIKPQTK